MSRTCILAIMESKGNELSPGVIEMLVRAGGWQAVTGATTVLRVYARKVVDDFLDYYSLALGYTMSNAAWQQRRRAYLGEAVCPKAPVIERGRVKNSFQVEAACVS